MEHGRPFISALSFTYRNLLKPILFGIDPETIHENAITVGEKLGKSVLAKQLVRALLNVDSPMLRQKINGIIFENPVGLAAGFDYNARLTQITPSLGFGWESVGTITNLPYAGNPPPMLSRLPKSKSLMVNKGFKNLGARLIVNRLKNSAFDIPVGISIGRTNSSTLKTAEQSVEDIISAFKLFEKSPVKHSYYELNTSCPNLINASESFYQPKNLDMLLREVEKLHIGRAIFVKMPIVKNNKEIERMLKIIMKYPSVKGVIFGNLQSNRKEPTLIPEEVAKFNKGNFSGKPTERRSNKLIKLAYRHYGKKLIIVGTGGIFSAEDAYRKIKLGASLVQLITGMVFQGPQLIAEINLGLIKLLNCDGFKNISEAIGIENKISRD